MVKGRSRGGVVASKGVVGKETLVAMQINLTADSCYYHSEGIRKNDKCVQTIHINVI